MLTNQKQFLYRLYFVASILVVLALGIGYRIFDIQFLEGEKYRTIAKEKTIKNFIITPKRGNIYSDDGSLLASSTTNYDVYFDAVTVTNKNFNKYINTIVKVYFPIFNIFAIFVWGSLNGGLVCQYIGIIVAANRR